MSVIRVYLKPFVGHTTEVPDPNYPDMIYMNGIYADEWTDVTDDVDEDSISEISRQIENDEYNIGVFRYNELTISFKNIDGRYSEADTEKSIFKFKRSESQIKITWDIQPFKPICGVVKAGEFQLFDEEIILYDGIINDDVYVTDIDQQKAVFKVLGYESLLQRIRGLSQAVLNTKFASYIYRLLDYNSGPSYEQDPTIALLIIDQANIEVGFEVEPNEFDQYVEDWKLGLADTIDAKQNLDRILSFSNSALYIENRTIIVTDKNPNQVDPVMTFYGQGSMLGAENIVDITEIKTGVNRTFNQWLFKFRPDLLAVSTISKSKYNLREKVLDNEPSTTDTRIQDYLDYMLSEWSLPKLEFKLQTKMTMESLALKFFDTINIDYPTIYFPSRGDKLPVYGEARYDVDYYPETQWAFQVLPNQKFKIMGIDMDLKQQLITFSLREI